MHSSKLITLLRGLRPDEIHWFQKFLKSPFFNNNTFTIRLFDYLKKYHPEFDSPKLDKEQTFKKLFPNEKFKIQKLRKVMYELSVLTEDFFVTMRLRNQKIQKKKLLVEEFGERNLYPQFEKGTKELMEKLEALPYRDTFFYKTLYELNYNYSNHQETNRQKLNGQLLKTATEHLDYFYLLQRQQLEFVIKSHEKLFKEKLKLNTQKQTKTELQKEPVFKIYELINKAISKPDEENQYLKIESLYKNEIEKLGRNDMVVVLKILLNYSSGQINKGKVNYFKIIFSLYKFGLAQNLFIEKNQISSTIFTNIITTAVNVKEFDWVEKFIADHNQFLPPSVKEDATAFGLGLVFFYKKDFPKTIHLLLNHNFLEPLHLLHAKTILIRTYFEQYLLDKSYFELLIAQTQAFEKFIRRNELISESKKVQYLNFVLFTKKIANGHWQNTLDPKLKEKINSSKEVLLKFWLIEKLEELQK